VFSLAFDELIGQLSNRGVGMEVQARDRGISRMGLVIVSERISEFLEQHVVALLVLDEDLHHVPKRS